MARNTLAKQIELLRACTLFSNLTDEQLQALASKLQPVTFRRNTVIFSKNDPGDALYIICSGRVKISVLNTEGKDLIINIYTQGDTFGEMSLFDGLPRSAAASAQDNVEALMLRRSSFEELIGGVPGLAVSIIALLSRRLRYTTQQTEMLGLFGAYDRVALKLFQLTQGAQQPYVIELSQQELAAMLGLTREWLSKVLKVFADEGAIEVNWGKITVLDAGALQRWI